MKKEYDFSKGKRGKFYRDDIQIKIPVYLDPENLEFVEDIAQKKNADLSSTVNEILKQNIKLSKSLL